MIYMTKMTQDLMDDVASLVNAQITEMGITHRTHRGDLTHTRLIGSPLRLRQIMLNLFSNAIKYNKPGGTQTILETTEHAFEK